MTARSAGPVDAVRAAVQEELDHAQGRPMVVALSGGLDSTVLLHALRFSRRGGASVSAAHFDHGMRPESRADAAWVRGVCRAWCVELVEGGVGPGDPIPTSEDQARTLRYSFLEEVTRAADATLLTAHHADDQAETVLFRVLRGTGIEGLSGIPRRRELGGDNGGASVPLSRPLLHLTRDDLEAYARACRVPYRPDPTNQGASFARNVIRNVILPQAEAGVAPGARRSLARLAEIAGEEEEAWTSAMRLVLPALDVRGVMPGDARDAGDAVDAGNAGGLSCGREALLELGPALAARVLRRLAAHAGASLDHDTTRRALDFVRSSQSGRYIELGGGVELHLKDRRVLLKTPPVLPAANPARGSGA